VNYCFIGNKNESRRVKINAIGTGSKLHVHAATTHIATDKPNSQSQSVSMVVIPSAHFAESAR